MGGEGCVRIDSYPSSDSPLPSATSDVRDPAVVRVSLESVHSDESRNDLREDESA